MNFDPYDKQKETAGTFATFTWIASSLYLFISSGYPLFSWYATLFIFIGMFFAAIVFGIVFYGMQRLTAKILVKTIPTKMTVNKQATLIKSIGLFIMLLEIVLIFGVASFSFSKLIIKNQEYSTTLPSDIMENSLALAYSLGEIHQRLLNCGQHDDNFSPAKVAGLFINYMSEEEVQIIINNYSKATEAYIKKPCDMKKTSEQMLQLTKKLALYTERAEPYKKPW